METLKHIVKIADNFALWLLGLAIAPTIKNFLDDKPIPSEAHIFIAIALIAYILIEASSLWLLYTAVDKPRDVNRG